MCMVIGVSCSLPPGLAWPRHAHASTYVVGMVQVAVMAVMAVMEVGNLLSKHTKGWPPSAFKRYT